MTRTAAQNGVRKGVPPVPPLTPPAPAPVTTWQLGTPSALDLAATVAQQDDLQAVLQCCERLLAELAPPAPLAPGLDAVVGSLWRTTLTAYARCFAPEGAPHPLRELDVVEAHPDHPEAVEWHRALVALAARDDVDPGAQGPSFTVGAVRGDDGVPRGIAVSAPERPLPDAATIRSAGTLAFARSPIVETRVTERQLALFAEVAAMSSADLDQLPRMQATPG